MPRNPKRGNIFRVKKKKEEKFSGQNGGEIREKGRISRGEVAKRGNIFRAKEERFSCEGKLLATRKK